MYTKREAAHLLGIDRNTLAKWARECGITDGEDPRDKRLHLLSDEDLRIIRERYADMHTFSESPAYHQQTTRTSLADMAARVAELEQRVAALERSAANLAPPLPRYVPPLPPRQIVTTASQARTPERGPVPAHLMSVPTWCDLHSVNTSRAKTWREKRKLPVERGQWLEERHGTITRIDTALTIEGREIAHQLAGIPWPCETCMLEESGLPATFAAVAGSMDYNNDDQE